MSVGDITRADLELRGRLAADRLTGLQQDSGYYLYKFHPFNGEIKSGPGNLVRQAGCAYAIGRAADAACESERRIELAGSASRVIDALLSRLVIGEGAFIAELPRPGLPVRGKLGTLALSLAAMQSASLAAQYRSERQLLVESVLSWQRSDGSFRCLTDSLSVSDDATKQDYFPGEALMAISSEMREGCERAQYAMAAAFPWYVSRFRAQPTIAFVSWQLEAWRKYSEWTMGLGSASIPDVGACSGFVYEMADWLMRVQIESAPWNPDVVGGYSQVGWKPGVSSACCTEAMIGAFSLAMQLGDSRRASRYRRASLMGLDFIRKLQVIPRNLDLFPDPARTLGGTVASLDDQTMRCDNDQHALTAYLSAIETSRRLAT